jgi:hypothetical protein
MCLTFVAKNDDKCKILDSHSGGYEEHYLLGYNAV